MSKKQDGSRQGALRAALKFLGYSPRSEAEVRAKLARLDFSKASIDATLARLRSLSYIDDENFAREWSRSKAEGRGYGPLRVERELRAKGIEASLVRRIIEETFRRGQGRETARKLLEKRFRGKDLGDEKVLRRAMAYLQRRGYRDSVIAEVLKVPFED